MLTNSKTKDEFDVKPITSDQMDRWVQECINIYQGNPPWLDADDNIDTVNFAKSVCAEVARLVMMGTGIHVDGSARGKWLDEQINKIYDLLREWVEQGCAYGTIILNPNGDTVEMYAPGDFAITHHKDGNVITGYPDGSDHAISALRYAYEPHFNKRGNSA